MVIAKGFQRLLVVFMRRIGERLQLFGIPPRTTRVFRRSHPGSFQQAGIASLWISRGDTLDRSEEHTSELQSLMRISYAVFCLKKKQEKTQDRVEARDSSEEKKQKT